MRTNTYCLIFLDESYVVVVRDFVDTNSEIGGDTPWHFVVNT